MPVPARLLLLPLLLGLATAQDRTRFDIASFELPTGWTKVEANGALQLAPPGGNATVTLARSTAIAGSVDPHGAALVEQAKASPDFRLEIAPESGSHRRSTGRWHRFVYSEADPARRGQFLYTALLSVAAGGRCVSFRMVTSGTAAYEEHRQVLGAMVDSVVLTSGQRLERGSPPLTRFMVDETVDFLEWLVHSPLTEDQRGTVESELRRYWREKENEEMAGITEMLSARAELAKLPEAQRELARQAVLAEALEGWRKDQSAGAQMMLAIHDAANQPIAQGEPPLTAQAVEAFAEFLNFAAGKTIGHDAKLPKTTREQLIAGVAEGYAKMDKEQRELITGMPMAWAALRAVWPELAPQQQQQYIAGWKANASIEALGKAMAAQKAAADEARGVAELVRDNQRRQAALQGQQMHFQMMQNILRMQSDTMKIMTSNLGGNTRYEYRW